MTRRAIIRAVPGREAAACRGRRGCPCRGRTIVVVRIFSLSVSGCAVRSGVRAESAFEAVEPSRVHSEGHTRVRLCAAAL